MANKEHLDILSQGAAEWNKWREMEDNFNSRVDLADTNFADPALAHIDIKSANFRRVILTNVNFTGANLMYATFGGANLSNANFNRANAYDADFGYANLTGADFREANLRYADINNADLTDAQFASADIIGTNFRDSILIGADFADALIGWTLFINNDLSKTKGLESAKHSGPSEVSISTIYESKGGIPQGFLRGSGIPENFITYMHSLTGNAFDYYSCFISFAESDDYFSERLYNDLQGRGIRCWRWKEDAKWGRTLMLSIDEAVQVYDKLIVICSEASLQSPAVIREVERALQKEDQLARQGKNHEVLFPIRLDDYIFTTWTHYRKWDVVNKHVGDFRQWNNPELYYKKLNRLVHDLKAEKSQ